ncbi:MAG: SH3 domain-containing protein [Xenococcaceae cyanobacterium]
MSISGLFQFILGFILGVFLFAGGTVGVVYLFFIQMATSPPKPVFSQEKSEQPTVAQVKSSPAPSTTEKQTPEPSPEKKEELEPGAYRARVTWPQGLSLRQESSYESQRIGGIGYNEEIIILKDSDDKEWQKVRVSGSGQEGWVKAGNVKKLEDED